MRKTQDLGAPSSLPCPALRQQDAEVMRIFLTVLFYFPNQLLPCGPPRWHFCLLLATRSTTWRMTWQYPSREMLSWKKNDFLNTELFISKIKWHITHQCQSPRHVINELR